MRTKRDYIIAYDISDKKRLSRLARYLEKVSFRIQYSIYLLPKSSDSELKKIQEDILKLLDKESDDLRIYKIKKKSLHAGIAVDLQEPFILT